MYPAGYVDFKLAYSYAKSTIFIFQEKSLIQENPKRYIFTTVSYVKYERRMRQKCSWAYKHHSKWQRKKTYKIALLNTVIFTEQWVQYIKQESKRWPSIEPWGTPNLLLWQKGLWEIIKTIAYNKTEHVCAEWTYFGQKSNSSQKTKSMLSCYFSLIDETHYHSQAMSIVRKKHSKMIQSNRYNNVGRRSGKIKNYIFHFQLHFPIMVFS